ILPCGTFWPERFASVQILFLNQLSLLRKRHRDLPLAKPYVFFKIRKDSQRIPKIRHLKT
ncbi:hypothetical protein, partial [Bacillus cereus]|uniref:hypothetical protein n=1 Tax=Bacillus cereus TaxID=1396 RepID=UPI00196A7B14